MYFSKKKVKNKYLKCIFRTQDYVENLGRKLQKLNESLYREEINAFKLELQWQKRK